MRTGCFGTAEGGCLALVERRWMAAGLIWCCRFFGRAPRQRGG